MQNRDSLRCGATYNVMSDIIRLSRVQLRMIDRLAVEKYGMPSIVLMENAARSSVDCIVEILKPMIGSWVVCPRVTILCGSGNNGGDGFAIARHLHNRSWQLQVMHCGNTSTVDAQLNESILRKMNVPIDRVDLGEIKSFQPHLIVWKST